MDLLTSRMAWCAGPGPTTFCHPVTALWHSPPGNTTAGTAGLLTRGCRFFGLMTKEPNDMCDCQQLKIEDLPWLGLTWPNLLPLNTWGMWFFSHGSPNPPPRPTSAVARRPEASERPSRLRVVACSGYPWNITQPGCRWMIIQHITTPFGCVWKWGYP